MTRMQTRRQGNCSEFPVSSAGALAPAHGPNHLEGEWGKRLDARLQLIERRAG
mgnify:CR=1 FL=1